jgi:hypothetical protein
MMTGTTMKRTTSLTSKQREAVTAASVMLVIIVLLVLITVKDKPRSSSALASSNTTSSVKAAPAQSIPANAMFKDGSYTAVGSYEAPGERENITVTLTLQNGVGTDASTKEGYQSSESQLYQDQFVSAYKQSVVGKKITDIKLSHVAASSLTSQGFNKAVQQIEQQAVVS